MKLALPLTATNEFSPHYGAATKFAVFDVDPGFRCVHRRHEVAPQAPAASEWPRFLGAEGVELVLAGGIASGTCRHMAEHGVRVLAGLSAAQPEELVTAWLEGRLVAGTPAGTARTSGAGSRNYPQEGFGGSE